ncbi:LADA_0F11122g1_1 [Lachancea dasiensis]|uniref:LADA_0F11122g1_1 n=1 Tax=Lachancea dasiensis TaxID=1072105 RepID=A0A1G4JML3_9SACH|nr:LADA_0F11122g1_1 [Lachancea dasiensis]
MSRISYVAPYFMPLLCSSKLWIKLILLLNVLALFGLAFSGSKLLISEYKDDSMFKPNGQDYFRTSLLGFFSPLALHFLRDFVLMVSPRAVLINLLVDFPFNVWFSLLIVFCLAYPQIQTAQIMGKMDDTVWHIIPRQAAIFGTSWALSEFLTCVVQNLQRYEEVPSPESAKRQLEYQLLQEEQDNSRKNITLSRCIEVKRKSSLISENVYTHEYQTPPATNPEHDLSEAVYVSFNDSSMSLLRDPEAGHSSNDGSGERRPRMYDGTVTYFAEISSKRRFLRQLLLFNLLVFDSVLLEVGHAFIVSIYFIYVPGHEELFTRAVTYFGIRTFGYFTLSVILPLSILGFIISIFLFVWNGNTRALSSESTYDTNSNSDLHIHASQPQSLQYISSDQLFVMNSIYTQDMMPTGDTELPILHFFRTIVTKWQILAGHRSFPIVGFTIWSLIMAAVGTLAAVEQ